jgi:hypothetical protein
MNIPAHHFPNDPPFDDDFDPEATASEWSPGVDLPETGTLTAIRTIRNQNTKRQRVSASWDDTSGEDEPVDVAVLNSPVLEEVSSDFISSWNRLISMTNWEKGKLIHNWRTKLMETGLPRQVYSDESLAKRLGNVSSQHIGRLRRVYDRFNETFEKFTGLYWSHFQAVLDWDDAQDWLVDASENQWSVATMRLQRWEAIGSPAGQKPNDADIIMSEPDEDVNPYNDSDTVLDGNRKGVEPNRDKDKKKKGDNSNSGGTSGSSSSGSYNDEDFGNFSSPAEAFAQMKQMKDLPEDLKEVFEQLKVVILSHKISGWREVDPQRILTFLNAMKVVVMTEEK